MNNLDLLATGLSPVDLKQCRRLVTQFLYQLEAQQSPILADSSLPIFLEQFTVPEKYHAFIKFCCNQIYGNIQRLDKRIEPHLRNWKIARLAKVDLAILRVCIFEIESRPNLPPEVIMSDAAEIGREFGTESSSAFVNGVLDSVCKATDVSNA